MDDEPNDTPADDTPQADEQPAREQPTEQSDEQQAEGTEQPADSEQPAEQSEEQPAESDQPAEQSEEQAADTDQPAEQSEEQSAESDQPAEQTEEQSAESDQQADRSEEEAADDQPAKQDADQPAVSPSSSGGAPAVGSDSEFRKRCSALLAKHEGRMKHVYLDTLQIPSIGIGFNLKRGGAREALAKVGADYDQVLAGTQDLSDEQIDALFNRDLDTALATAQRQVPNFADLASNARLVIVDMAFMGEGGLAGFKKMIAALKELDYNTAANEMMNSQWYVQVKNRGVEDVALMRAAAG